MNLRRVLTARRDRPDPDHCEQAEIEGHHAERRNEQVGGEHDLEGVHCHEAECLHGGARHRLPPGEDPEAEQNFADTDDVRGEVGVSLSEDACDDGAVTRDSAKQFAEESVEDPDRADEDLGGEEHGHASD
jgi:hypothetical protein